MTQRSFDMKAAFSLAAAGAIFALSLTVAGAAQRDGAVIRDSGSTNFSGYTIKVWSDGSVWAVHSNRIGQPIGTAATGHVPATLAQAFLTDAREGKAARPAGVHCMKSASFGSSRVVEYHGWTSPDLNCPVTGELAQIAGDATQIASQLHLQNQPMRTIPMLQHEPRRAPGNSGGQATAMPEPTSSPS